MQTLLCGDVPPFLHVFSPFPSVQKQKATFFSPLLLSVLYLPNFHSFPPMIPCSKNPDTNGGSFPSDPLWGFLFPATMATCPCVSWNASWIFPARTNRWIQVRSGVLIKNMYTCTSASGIDFLFPLFFDLAAHTNSIWWKSSCRHLVKGASSHLARSCLVVNIPEKQILEWCFFFKIYSLG